MQKVVTFALRDVLQFVLAFQCEIKSENNIDYFNITLASFVFYSEIDLASITMIKSMLV